MQYQNILAGWQLSTLELRDEEPEQSESDVESHRQDYTDLYHDALCVVTP